MKRLLCSICWIVILLNANYAYAWTWAPVLPYKIDFPNGVSVTAIPYTADRGPILLNMGLTQVYKNGKLLYNIPSYFDEEIAVSKDASVFAVVRTYSSGNIIHETFLDGTTSQIIHFDMPVIWLFRMGELVKIYTLRDVVNELALRKAGEFRSWGYEFDYNSEDRLKKEISHLYKKADRYKEVADSIKFFSEEKQIYDNKVYVKNDVLNVYTKLKTIVSIEFSNLSLKNQSVDPKMIRGEIRKRKIVRKKYEPINVPRESTSPRLINRSSLDSALATLLNWKISQSSTGATKQVSIGLLIETDGFCRKISVHVYDSPESYDRLSLLEEEECIKQWLAKQKFDAADIPKGYDAYLYSGFYYFY